jgi:hypothetical protein
MKSNSWVFGVMLALAFGGAGAFVGFATECAMMLGETEVHGIENAGLNVQVDTEMQIDPTWTLVGGAIGISVFLVGAFAWGAVTKLRGDKHRSASSFSSDNK